jgi:DNA-binding ferritin-like protein
MEQIIIELLTIQNQFRIYHWQTKSFARHSAFGDVYSELDGLIDEFVEVCMGKHGRPSFSGGYTLGGSDIEELELTEYINSVCEYLVGLSEDYDPKMDSDLLNIRDEMLAEINKLKYLLTLK